MRKLETGRILNILLLCWFILTPVFWRIELSKSTYNPYDMLVMAPYGVLHLVIFYIISAVSIYFNKVSLHHILFFTLYFPFIQFANYPYFTAADVYAHAAPAEKILVDGQLVYGGSSRPESFPASFYLHAILTIVSGCNLINANYILYSTLVIIIVLVLYSFAQRLERKGYGLAWAGALLLPCLFFNHLFAITRYSRTALAFTFLFLFFLSFMRQEDSRNSVLQILIIVSVVITHPFQSIAVIATISAYVVISRGRETRLINLAIFSIVTFVGWLLFHGYYTIQEAIDQLFSSPDYITPVTWALPTREAVAWWGPILSEYFKYSLAALLAVTFFVTIIVLLKTKKNRITMLLSSFFFSSIVVLATLVPLAYWKISYSTGFLAFPAAFSSLILSEELLKKERLKRFKNLLTKKSMSTMLLLFIVSLSAASMVLRFRTNQYFGEMYHPAEESTLSFFFTHDYNSTVYIVSWKTSAYAYYFDYNSSHEVLRIWHIKLNKIRGNLTELLSSQNQLINQSQFVLRGMRDAFTLFEESSGEAILRTHVDQELIIPNFDLIYSNGYYSIYKRVISPPLPPYVPSDTL